MKRNNLIVAAVLGLLLIVSPVYAQEEPGPIVGEAGIKKVNLSGMQFLKIGQGARAVGMGDAFTAVADDINAIFWNGAGLVHVERFAYQANYTRWIGDTNVYSLAAAWNTRSSRGEVLGFSILSHQPPTILETTVFQPTGTGGTVDVSQISVGFLYMIKFTDKLSVSAKVNYVQEVLFDTKTQGFIVDIGSFFYTGFKSLRVAMALKNFGPDRTVEDRAYLMPLFYIMGVAGEVYGEKSDPSYLTLSAESVYAIDYEQRYHFGAELWLQNTLALRAGWKWNYDLESIALGAGFKQTVGGRTFNVDIAYSVLQKEGGVSLFGPPIRISVGGAF